MTIRKLILPLLLISLAACRKEVSLPANQNKHVAASQQEIEQARNWVAQQTELKSFHPDWKLATIMTARPGEMLVPIEGQPVYQNVRQGYRRLLIKKDNKARTASILELIPDAYLFQKTGRPKRARFTGRIFQYDSHYVFQFGRVLHDGKITGEVKATPVKSFKKLSYEDQFPSLSDTLVTTLSPLNFIYEQQFVDARISCQWFDSFYIDADGVFTIHSTRICTTGPEINPYSAALGDYGQGSDSAFGQGGGSSGSSAAPAPPVSNLPGEDKTKNDPKKLVKCFSGIADQGSVTKITLYIQEAAPGTSFNIGTNSFGHVAIGLTKTSGGQSITQVIGFYPDASGADRLNANSKILDNGMDFIYNISATYTATPENFQNILNYISNPPGTYNALDFNCVNFAYQAMMAGNINLPNPTVTVGLTGPAGATTAMTPAGLASAYRKMKADKPNSDINTSSGLTPASKGECN